MKKTKKQMVAAGLALVMAVSLVGCGNSGGDSQKEDGQITLKFSFDQGVGEATQKIVDKFNESQDKIKVETVLLPQDANQVHDDFVNKLASGDKSVDIMGLDVVYVAEFASAGWLMDLTNKIDTDAMLDGPVEGATYDGKLVAAPWFTNSSVLFYRQDVLEQLGAEVPTTYEGWMELADQAVGINGIEYGADFQAAQSEALVTNWVEYVWNNGGDVLDESGDPVINSENNVEATNIMKKLVDEYAPEGITTYTETESEQVFKEESHTCLGGLDLVVNNAIDEKQKAAAVEFINYMMSADTQKEMTLISSQPPVVKDVYTDSEILEEIPFYADFYDIIMTGKSRPLSPKYAKVSDAIQRNIHQALTGETDVVTALDKLQEEVEALNNKK